MGTKNYPYCLLASRNAGSREATKIEKIFRELGMETGFIEDLDIVHAFFQKLHQLNKTTGHMILVIAGGDGAISFAVNQLFKLKISMPIIPLPLGTGNEISYSTGWGEYWRSFKLNNLFNLINEGTESLLDIWEAQTTDSENKVSITNFVGFLSVGIDADIVYNHAKFREKFPLLYRFRYLSFFWYFIFGILRVVKVGKPVGQHAQIETEKGFFGLKNAFIFHFLNIPSSGGHADYFGYDQFINGSIETFYQPSCSDKVIEIAATRSRKDYLRAALNLGPVARVTQARCVKFQVGQNTPIRMQIDGNTFYRKIIKLSIRHVGQQKIILGNSKLRGFQRE